MKNKKVILGLSGGVDSTTSAYLLKKQGYDVVGVFFRLFDNNKTEVGLKDSKAMAEAVGIEYEVLDYREEFKKEVIEYFIDEYACGRTPNPCVKCNKFIKWKLLYDKMIELDGDFIATGHYANIATLENGDKTVSMSVDKTKDQTYMLYNLNQDILKHIIFPLSGMEKTKVREIAKEAGLMVAEKRDSQEICFIDDDDYKKFLMENIGDRKILEGNFVDTEGKVLGRHKGLLNYTIGQRKGLNIALGKPMYVVELDTEKNEVVLGEDKDLFKTKLIAKEVNFVSLKNVEEIRLKAKVRYASKPCYTTIKRIDDDTYECTFDEEVRAISKGQSVVFYDEDERLAGGGVIY